MKEKEQHLQGAPASPEQPVAGSPEDLNKRAQNENPRANENIQDKQDSSQPSDQDVGSEITDGEDA